MGGPLLEDPQGLEGVRTGPPRATAPVSPIIGMGVGASRKGRGDPGSDPGPVGLGLKKPETVAATPRQNQVQPCNAYGGGDSQSSVSRDSQFSGDGGTTSTESDCQLLICEYCKKEEATEQFQSKLQKLAPLRYFCPPCNDKHVRVVYYDYATEEQPYCNTNTSCPRLPYHCLTGSLRYTHLQLRLSSVPLVSSSAWPDIAQ